MQKIRKLTIFLLILPPFFAICCGCALGALLAFNSNTVNTENFSEFTTALPTRLLDINGELITEFSSDEKREIIAINQLPQHMIDALVTREDQIFYKHSGYSFKALIRAVIGQVIGRSLGGGSTLTQQIAGTLYCDRSEKSISRKIKELWWAVQMERRYSKDEILELYLNKIYFGGGTYGVNAASKYYFGHSAEKITPAEAAILVIQLSNPAYYNPFEYPNRAMDRQKNVLTQMVEHNYLTQAQADASFEDYWVNFDYTRINSSAYYMRDDKAPWFSEYVLRELTSMMYGTLDVYTGGFTVNTTVNLKNQTAAQNIMSHYIEYANQSYRNSSSARSSDAVSTYIPMTELLSLIFNIPQLKLSEQRAESSALNTYTKEINPILDVMALMFNIDDLKLDVINRVNSKQEEESDKTTIEGTMISIENDTGYITAIVGGSKFDQNNQFIRATQAKIQPGSSFKPLYYSAAIDSRKFTPATILYDTPTVFYKEDGAPYIPQNFKGEWLGSVQVWYALATSMNVVSIKVLDGIGFDAAIDRATSLLGIPEDQIADRHFDRVYPLGLGICSVRPIEMARAFAIFANQGKEVDPIAIRTVEDKNGTVILNPERDLRLEQQQKGDAAQIISPQTAFIMTDLLQNTVRVGTLARGSGWGSKFVYTDKNGKKFTMPAGGKTGTTQNWADAWTVGFTPYYTTAVWFGFDKAGQTLGLELTGATLAGVAWGDYMKIANSDLPFRDFVQPQTGLVKATVCSVSGQILTDACGSHQTTQYFLEGTQPTVVCELHTMRETARTIGITRLNSERLLSGESYTLSDFEPITVDLSFLDVNYSENNSSYQSSIDDYSSSSVTVDSSNSDTDSLNDFFTNTPQTDSVPKSTSSPRRNYLLE